MRAQMVWILAGTMLLTLALPASLSAQAPSGEVIMLEEIKIRVEPELPTVMVTLSRLDPVIETGALARPVESTLLDNPANKKPALSKVEVNKIENPQKILAKPREP